MMKNQVDGEDRRPPQVDLHVLLAEVQQLNHCSDNKVAKILQKLSSTVTGEFDADKSTWRPPLIEILRFIMGDGRLELQILAARVYLTIVHKVYPASKFDDVVRTFLAMERESPCLGFHKADFRIDDVESFKLTIINGYLGANRVEMYSEEICRAAFGVLEAHCMTYTYHTYPAFRLLALWLDYTRSAGFWGEGVADFEEKMDTLIFSNWDNCISEAAKINATQIFPAFVRIMDERYPEFIQKAREHVMAQLSWRNPLKYVILTQITKITHELDMESNLIQEVVRALERAELTDVATGLYVAAWSDMHEYAWLETYVSSFHPVVKVWEEENRLEALERLWQLWLNPTLPKFCNNLLRLLWDKFFKEQMVVCQSYLVKLATERDIPLTALFRHSKFRFNHQNENQPLNTTIDSLGDVRNVWVVRSDTRVPFVLDDARDCVRLNGFAVYCRGTEFKSEEAYGDFIADPVREFSEDEGEDTDPNYEICQWFLYHNAKTSRTMREEIVQNVEILLQRICSDVDEKEKNFLQWLYDFIFDCLEIGSCSRRKIFGLRLYQVLLSLINSDPVGELKLTVRQSKHLTQQTKQSFYVLATLCTDAVGEVREKACAILVDHFGKTPLMQEENDALAAEAQRCCLSSKFHEVSGGVKLWRVVARRTQDSDPLILLGEARSQLSAVMERLEAMANGAPFYDTLMIFDEISFDPQNDLATAFGSSFLQELTGLLEEAVTFFLKVSRMSEDVRKSIPVEIAEALGEIYRTSHMFDDLDLSPGHRDVLSGVWTSLKSICELAAKLAYIKRQVKETYERLIRIVTSVLAVCRHRGVTKAAGNVLVHLMDNKHLDDDCFLVPLERLFSITKGSQIQWEGDGEREVFLLHQLLSHNEETTGALLRTVMNRIMEFLQNSIEANRSNDEDLARHFRYLRSIVLDKSLHPVYAQYLEQISLFCLSYFRSDNAALRAASFQLFGASTGRISGEPKDGDLDFGTGYSLDHFCTHYPGLAAVLLKAVKEEVTRHTKSLEIDEAPEDYDGSIEPILLLLSRISVTGSCFLEHSHNDYRREMTYELMLLFAHPVRAARELAAKAYAALTLPQRIAPLLFFEKTTDPKDDDRIFNHGSYLSQVYLQMRAGYESVCCSREDAEKIRDGTNHQLDKLREMVNGWTEGKCQIDYVVEAMFLRCLLTSPELKNCDRFSGCSLLDSEVVREKIEAEGSSPGFWEFLEHLVELHCFFFDVDECSAGQLLEVFSRIDRYTVTVMKHLKNMETLSTEVPAEDVEKFFNEEPTIEGDTYGRISTLMEREELIQEMSHKVYRALVKDDAIANDYLTDVIKFIIRVTESGTGVKGVQMQNPNFDIVRLITKLINSTNYSYQKLGYRMIAIAGDDFDNYGYKRKLLEFIASVVVTRETDKLWALDCLEMCLRGKKFTSMDDVLQLKILESLIELLNDPEAQPAVCRKLTTFELIPRPANCSDLPRNPANYLHELLRVAVTSHALSQDQVYREWVHDVADCTVHDRTEVKERNDVGCQDETYREDGKIVNILTHLIRHVKSSSRDFPDVVYDKLNISQIIKIGNRYQEDYIGSQLSPLSDKLSTIFNINVESYLAHKKRILHDIIEQRKKRRF